MTSEPDASFWAEPEQVLVSVFHPSNHPDEWEVYVAGLQQCYQGFGAGHIVERSELDRQSCGMFWLFRDKSGEPLGGVRAVGPINAADQIDQIPAVAELRHSPTADLIRASLIDVAPDGLIEAKGAWSAPGVKGLGGLVGRFLWHCGWWFSSGYTLGTSGVDHNIEQWKAYGGVPIPGAEPAPDYPLPGHHTVPLLLSMARCDELPEEVKRQLANERSYLHPARNRAGNQPASGVEVIVNRDRVADLQRSGVELRTLVEDLQVEANDCRSPDAPSPGASPSWPWVHYPWRNCAIQVLEPDAYHSLRTDRNRHKLTAADMRLLRRKKIGVVGLSVGNAIAFALAQEGLCGELRLADFDTVELSNLNRLSASLTDLGEPKTAIAARRIAELDPFLDVRLYEQGIEESNLLEFLTGLDLVIEECDSLDVKVMVRRAAADLGIPVVMESNDRGLLDVERFDLDQTRKPFHGLVGDVDGSGMAGLTSDEKVPYVLGIIDGERISTSLAASMVEIDQTVSSWPQLASDVALGAALVVHAARDILLGRSQRSGRVRVDLDELATALEEPERPAVGAVPPVTVRRPELPADFEQAIIVAAGLAPSGGNMQPWRFDLTDERFSIRSAGDDVGMDIGGRGTAVSCGAAMFNAMCVAAAHRRLGEDRDGGDGYGQPDLTLDLDDPRALASLRLGTRGDADLADLAGLLARRTTNRQLDPRTTPLPKPVLRALEGAARAAGGRLRFVAAADLGDLRSAWAESDRLRFLTARLHREMFDEVRRPGIDPLDTGIDERTLEMSAADLAKLAVVRRPDVVARLNEWDAGHRLGEDVTKRLDQSAGLLVVTVDGTARPDYVRGGMALQRLWLEATRHGIGLQPVSPIFGYAQTTAELIDLVGPARAPHVADLQAGAFRTIGMEPGESFVLALRAHLGPQPSAISDRALATATPAARPVGTASRA